MRLEFKDLHISLLTVLQIVNNQDKKKNKILTDYGLKLIENKQYYAKVQCSFMNIFKNSAFKKL